MTDQTRMKIYQLADRYFRVRGIQPTEEQYMHFFLTLRDHLEKTEQSPQRIPFHEATTVEIENYLQRSPAVKGPEDSDEWKNYKGKPRSVMNVKCHACGQELHYPRHCNDTGCPWCKECHALMEEHHRETNGPKADG